MKALATAQMEMNSIIAERRILMALKKNIPSSSDHVYSIGEEILIYREKPNKWVGPFRITSVNDKLVSIYGEKSKRTHTFNKQDIKPYNRQPTNNAAEDLDILHCMMKTFRSSSNPKLEFYNVLLSEEIKPNDPRASLFNEAKVKEINGLIERGTWKIVCKDDVPTNANILGGRFVLTIKNTGTDQELYKARFVVQGYRDKLNTSLVHDATTCRPQSARLLIGLAAIFGFTVFSTDVTQAYLQSNQELQREVFLNAPPELHLNHDQLLKLLKPLYGLPDSGDYWARTMKHHLVQQMGMTPTLGDKSFFFKHIRDELHGLCATYVDDALQAGDPQYIQQSKTTEKVFECRKREYKEIKFSGIQIESNANEGYSMHQKEYLKKLQKIKMESTYHDYQSLRSCISWNTLTRPDVSCAVAKAQQLTEIQFSEEKEKHVKSINALVSYIHRTEHVELKFPKLDHSSLRIQAYTDAAFSDNADLSSQLGYIIFLADKSNNCQPLIWSSHKSKRVTRSVLGSEVMAFADGFDMAYSLKHDLQLILKKEMPLVMLTDSLSLFDIVTKASSTKEKRLAIDLACVNQAYQNFEIHTLGFIRSENNPADALTKVSSRCNLKNIIASHRLDHPVDQWIKRQTHNEP